MANKKEQVLDDFTKWAMFDKFTGINTINDPEKVSDSQLVEGQNISFNNGDKISLRNLGYETFGDLSAFSTTDPITSVHTFRRRDGVSILMASFGTYMCYYNSASSAWVSLFNGFTSGKRFGFADYTLHTDLSSQVYFGNAVDDFSRWTGNFTKLTTIASVGDGSINVESTAGFPTTGNIVVGDTSYPYTSITATSFVLSGTITAEVANGYGVHEQIDMRSGATFPKGNIYLIANNRLFISGVTGSPQAVYFSKYGDPLDFSSTSLVTGSTSTASGTFNLAEGGGSVTGLIFDEGSIYAFKRTMIYKITLSDTLYILQQIKPFDGKSQTIGGVAPKCLFTGANYVFFITPDSQFMSLERVESVDYPQNVPISLAIKPSVKYGEHSTAAGISFNDMAFFSTKSSPSSPYNDIVYPWNISNTFWDAPITGWNASDFAVYANDDVEDLYFGSSNSTNVYKIISDNRDDIYGVKGLIKSKQFTFGAPQSQKIITDLFIEGYITDSTNLSIKLYLDDDGYTQTLSTILSGSEKDFQFSTGEYNTFGSNPFSIEKIGSNEDFAWLTKFRIYLNKDFRLKPFYNAQIEFSSEGTNQDWEVIQYGFKVGPYTKNSNRKLFKTFS